MNSADIIKLAKVFDQFISLKTAVVKLSDISTIRKSTNGIEVVTGNGTFKDGEEFEKLICRIQDAVEVLKENDRRAEIVQKAIQDPIPTTPQPIGVAEVKVIKQAERKVIPLDTAPGKQKLQTTISVGLQGAQGNLFNDPTLQIVDRSDLLIMDPTGKVVLAKAGEGSSIKGDKVGGFIHTNGKYTMTFKEYPHTSALVSYSVMKKPSV